MPIDKRTYARFLEQVAEDIDIPPGKYQQAVERYRGVGRWLEQGEYPGCSAEPDMYPQGSFRLGTVVRPVRNGIEASYDIDLVCELPISKDRTTPGSLKTMVGNRIKENGTYEPLLDDEGRRCWTLEYAEQDGIGFHLDVLPAVPDRRGPLDSAIAITHKDNGEYSWSASNPRGYGAWFDQRNEEAFGRVRTEQKLALQARAPNVFTKVDDVPDQLVRTPLQRAIQLMKRHRDVNFDNPRVNKYAPISIIITTLSALFYQNEHDVYAALAGIVSQLHAHAASMNNGMSTHHLSGSPIQRTADGRWYIGNPINRDENFADRWHEDDHARARAFFAWVDALRDDLVKIVAEKEIDLVKRQLSQSLGIPARSQRFSLLGLAPAMSSPPRIQIKEPAKPWRQ